VPLSTPLPTTDQRQQEAAQQTPAARSVLRSARARPSAFALLLTLALLVANAIARHSFLTPGNWPALIGTLAPFVLVALASTPPILGGGGGIDISVGPLTALVNCLFVQVLVPHGVSSPGAAIPILLLLGVAVGTVNGLLVVVIRLQPVIATLAMFFVLSGVALDIAPNPVTLPAGNWTVRLATSIGGVPGGLITMAAAAAIWLVLRRTAYVRTLYAVGSDDVAVFSAGVNVNLVRVGAYMLTGVFGAIAGIALTAVIQISEPSLTTTYTLIALAAVSLGGTSFRGGRGGLVGSFLGACSIFLLQELLSATGASTNYVQMVYGALLIAGVVIAGLLSPARSEGRS
jgi:ribose transport system permease protein